MIDILLAVFMLSEALVITHLWKRFQYLNTRLEYLIKINHAEHEILKGN